jgi:hypothetical protein
MLSYWFQRKIFRTVRLNIRGFHLYVKSMAYLHTAQFGTVLAETHKTIINRAYLKRSIFSRTG